ncbi:hypothetical protein M2322_000811 [Rhodoblastus acidophilus]|uniref:hypothetical protein n=1 Tax=Rhodoblastus acidophilus TaxID=1074 RepID=UPI0022247787|nr:hypothetical protein [Rhodoblastus acidophilus]MCW2315277.1 hypothetical protein [Rhodoblastus acidophilus]
MFGETSIEHMRDMMRRIDTNSDATAPNGFSEAKLGRWLGWLQGVACGLGVLTLEEAKAINMRWAGDAAPEEADWAPAPPSARDAIATAICNHPSIRAMGVDSMCELHGFIQETIDRIAPALTRASGEATPEEALVALVAKWRKTYAEWAAKKKNPAMVAQLGVCADQLEAALRYLRPAAPVAEPSEFDAEAMARKAGIAVEGLASANSTCLFLAGATNCPRSRR